MVTFQFMSYFFNRKSLHRNVLNVEENVAALLEEYVKLKAEEHVTTVIAEEK